MVLVGIAGVGKGFLWDPASLLPFLAADAGGNSTLSSPVG